MAPDKNPRSPRKAAVAAKIPTIQEIAAGEIARGNKVVYYTSYHDPASILRREGAPDETLFIDGKTSSAQRVRAVRRFHQDSDANEITITAAGTESIDLTPATAIIFGNQPLTYADYKQTVDRLHRRGQDKVVRVYDPIAVGTIDVRIEALITAKREEFERLVADSKEEESWFAESDRKNAGMVIGEMLESLV